MELPEDKKFDVLMAQLQERYTALHKMRDRSMQFVLWILGFAFGMAWLLIREDSLSPVQKGIVVFLIIVISLISFVFVHGIARGFRNNRDILVRLESTIGLYEPGFYGPKDSVLPKSFSEKKARCTDHFNTLYLLMAAVFLLLLLLTFINPCKSGSARLPSVSDPNLARGTAGITYSRLNNG